MGANSQIQWTDDTDNIIVARDGGWWCRKVKGSGACDNCYAEQVNDNGFFGGNHLPYAGTPPPLELRRDILAKWARQTRPRKHFVMSLSDIFGEWIERAWQFEFLDAMYAAPLQTFQMLTKRTNIGVKAIKLWMAARGITKPPANMWFGFTAEDQKHFDQRWKFAKQLAEKGFTIFVSLEPLLGPIVLPADFLALGRRAQVIVGGESGKNARPLHPDWVLDLRRQCNKADVAFFFKQWGEWVPYDPAIAGVLNGFQEGDAMWWTDFDARDGHVVKRDAETTIVELVPGRPITGNREMVRVGKKIAGRVLAGRTWDEFPVSARTTE